MRQKDIIERLFWFLFRDAVALNSPGRGKKHSVKPVEVRGKLCPVLEEDIDGNAVLGNDVVNAFKRASRSYAACDVAFEDVMKWVNAGALESFVSFHSAKEIVVTANAEKLVLKDEGSFSVNEDGDIERVSATYSVEGDRTAKSSLETLSKFVTLLKGTKLLNELEEKEKASDLDEAFNRLEEDMLYEDAFSQDGKRYRRDVSIKNGHEVRVLVRDEDGVNVSDEHADEIRKLTEEYCKTRVTYAELAEAAEKGKFSCLEATSGKVFSGYLKIVNSKTSAPFGDVLFSVRRECYVDDDDGKMRARTKTLKLGSNPMSLKNFVDCVLAVQKEKGETS